jgi:hypothetical protein
MLKSLQSLQGVSVLSKDAQKKVNGGCGVILTSHNNGSCVSGGMSKSAAIAAMKDAQAAGWGDYDNAHWCCASCGYYQPCDGDV